MRNVLIIQRKAKASICSLFLQVIDHLFDCDSKDITPIVNFSSENLLCFDKKYGKNVWEYFFDPVSDLKIENIEEQNRKIELRHPNPQNIHYYLGRAGQEKNYRKKFRKGRPPKFNSDYRKKINAIIIKYIKIKPHILNEVDNIYKNFSKKKTLCVFVRGANKVWNKVEDRMMPLDIYFSRIDFHLKSSNFEKIYLVCDNQESLPVFQKKFGDLIFFNQNFMRYPFYNSGADQPWDEPGFGPMEGKSKGDLCKENIIETVLMSKCDMLIHPEGNMGIVSLFLNPNMKHEFLT